MPVSPASTYLLAAWFFGLLSVFLIVTVVLLALRLASRPAEPPPLADPQSRPPEPEPAAPAAADRDEVLSHIESSKHAIQQLLRRLAECVSDLTEHHSSYDDRMEHHRLAIQKAMTLASLEEIERLIVQEIEEMRAAGQNYRAQLDQAHARIREQNEAMARIQADARLDYLTQMPNRRAFEVRLGEEMDRCQRYGSPLSMLLIDIDHFKNVNDTYGHPAGDRMLQLVGMLLQKNVRLSDLACRYGGEEFGVLLPQTPLRPARFAAEKIRRVVEESALMQERTTIRVTVSIGVGELDSGDTARSLVERVDAALYRAKQGGRNRTEMAESSPTDAG